MSEVTTTRIGDKPALLSLPPSPTQRNSDAGPQFGTGLRRLPRRMVYALVPTLLRTHILKEPVSPRKLHATSWMDGIRGLSAIAVFNLHYLFNFIQPYLGYHTTARLAETKHIAFLPPFCIFWDGGSAVNVFFAIAGYVCSLRALQLMQKGPSAYGQVLNALSSSSFRRTFRLWLPTIVMSLFITLLAYFGGFGITDPMFAKDARKKWFAGVSEEINPRRMDALSKQLRYWIWDLAILSNLWKNDPQNIEHDPHYWTIAYEYRASLQVYAALLLLARCKPMIRLVALCVIGVLFAFWGRIEGPLFFFGAAAAQWDVFKEASGEREKGPGGKVLLGHPVASPKHDSSSLESGSLPAWINPRNATGLRRSLTSMSRTILYAIAIYFMAYPKDGFGLPSFGYTWVNAWIPVWYWHREFRFPKTIGTLLLLNLLRTGGDRPGYWHKALTSDFAQYCGKVMFAFYLVHGTVLHAIGYAVPWWTWNLIGGNAGNVQWFIGIFAGWSFSLALSFWVADIFHREIESRCMSVTKWIEARCVVS